MDGIKLNKKQLRRIIKEALSTEVPELTGGRKSSFQVRKEKELAAKMYDQGREDSFAGIRPQLPDGEYMRGYNEAQEDAGLPRMQPPSDSGRGKKLDPSKLKGAFAGKYYGSR